METVCRNAIKQGLTEIAITDHFEPRPNENTYKHYDAMKIWLEIKQMNRIFLGKLKMRMGIEIGQPHQFQQQTLKTLWSVPYDYVLASVHYLHKMGDVGLACALGENPNQLMQAYLKEIDDMIDFDNFDCVGHIDLLIRYCHMYDMQLVAIDEYQDQVEVILKKLIAKGKGIEINTSGLRMIKLGRPLITKAVLKRYKQLGGEILTVGSDAHCANDVGKGIKQAIELAEEVGFQYITTFQERNPIWISIKNGHKAYVTKDVG
jgi:histidinol-phosphatase (PHP family)